MGMSQSPKASSKPFSVSIHSLFFVSWSVRVGRETMSSFAKASAARKRRRCHKKAFLTRFCLRYMQGLSVLHRHDEIPSALKPVQVRLWRRRRLHLTVARPDQQADGRNHQQSRFHHVQTVDSCVAEGKLRATS